MRRSLPGILVKDALLLLSAGLLLGAVEFGLPSTPRCPPVPRLRLENPPTTALMEIRRAEAKGRRRRYKPLQTWVPMGRISPFLKDAVVAAEDDRFFQHKGVEWALMRQAFIEDFKTGRKRRGASTITQQLAKNLYLSPVKSYWRKLRELAITLELERELPKRRILEIYLNVAEWGDGIFGAEAAARAYFHKQAADLTLDEAVALAAVLPSPRRFSPAGDSRWVARRKEWVYRRMMESGRLPPPPEPVAPLEEPLAPPDGEPMASAGGYRPGIRF